MKAIAPVTTPVLVELTDGQPTTTSLDVAAHFRKQHKTVLRAIANLECSPEFNRHNFAPIEYTDTAGRKYTQYRMTRDGFTFLCMGFTGKEAAQWKEAYIRAFNQIESELVHKAQATPEPSLLNRRWLVFFDHNGKEHVKPIPDDAGVMTHRDMLKAITTGDIRISTEELFEFSAAVQEQLKRRAEYQAERLKQLQSVNLRGKQ